MTSKDSHGLGEHVLNVLSIISLPGQGIINPRFLERLPGCFFQAPGMLHPKRRKYSLCRNRGKYFIKKVLHFSVQTASGVIVVVTTSQAVISGSQSITVSIKVNMEWIKP